VWKLYFSVMILPHYYPFSCNITIGSNLLDLVTLDNGCVWNKSILVVFNCETTSFLCPINLPLSSYTKQTKPLSLLSSPSPLLFSDTICIAMDNPLDAGEVLVNKTNSKKYRDPKQRYEQRHVESLSQDLGEAVFDRNKPAQASKNDKKVDTTIQSCLSYSKQPPKNWIMLLLDIFNVLRFKNDIIFLCITVISFLFVRFSWHLYYLYCLSCNYYVMCNEILFVMEMKWNFKYYFLFPF